MNQTEEFNPNQEQYDNVHVFFRNCRKEAKMVLVRSPAPPLQLVVLASICFNVPQSRVILFYNGFRIDNYELPVHITERGIVHVIDHRNLEQPEIIVTFRPLWNSQVYKIALPSDTRIKRVVEEFLVPRVELPEEKFFLVYVGKVLNRANQLVEQCVEDGAEINLVMYKKPECTNRIAVERSFSKRTQLGKPSVHQGCPVTYLTSIQSLKKKSQQLSENLNSQKSAEPKPSSGAAQKSNSAKENDGSESAGPLEKSAMYMSKNDKKFLAAAGNSEERAAPEEKGGSSASFRSGSGVSAGIKIVITGSVEEKQKVFDGKILELQSKTPSSNEVNEAKKDKGSLQRLLESMESESEK